MPQGISEDVRGAFPATAGPGGLLASMSRRWRAVRAGLAFAAFGVGSLFIAVVALPVLALLPGDTRQRRLRGQWLVHQGFRALVWFARGLRLVRVVHVGVERLRGPGPRLVVANHPTLIDVVLLIACLPQADCVVKHAHWRNPVLRRVVAGTGYLPNTNGDDLIDACVDLLRQGRTLILFPEGTRSPHGRLGRFHRGAAHIALRSGCDPIPVTIRCEPLAFVKGARWYDIPDRLVQITVEVGNPLVLRTSNTPDRPLTARRVTTALKALFEERLAHG
jgi:1-acyl-sn-glycerol-3-phosphate acyltransferase